MRNGPHRPAAGEGPWFSPDIDESATMAIALRVGTIAALRRLVLVLVIIHLAATSSAWFLVKRLRAIPRRTVSLMVLPAEFPWTAWEGPPDYNTHADRGFPGFPVGRSILPACRNQAAGGLPCPTLS
jgi:hypothetical protein